MCRKKHYPLIIKAAFILILVILPMNVLCLFTANSLIKGAQETLYVSASLPLQSQMNIIDNKIKNSNFFLYDLPNSDANCIAMLSQADDWTYTYHNTLVFKTVYNSLSMTNSADQLFFYMKDKDDLLNISVNSHEKISNSFIMDLIGDSELINYKWHLVNYEDKTFLFRSINNRHYCYGVFINLQNSITDIENSFSYSGIILSFDTFPIEKADGYMVVSSKSANIDLYLNLLIPASEFTKNLAIGKKFIFAAFIIFLFIIPALYYLFRREVSKPLDVLNEAHHQLILGNEDYHITTPALTSDFEQAYRSFDTMSDTLKRLRIENLNKELSAKLLQLDNLKLQIRPHFLLNTLNFLYTLIQNNQNAPAQELILYLSRYFRYMFRDDKDLAMFNNELELIQEYLKISQIHYPGEFQVSYQIDPAVSQIRIPPLLLHNFFENIVQHSLCKGHIVHIIFFAQYDNRTVTFQISDDGRGISPEEVERINHYDYSNPKAGYHIGIRNSMNRLKYYYGDAASLSVESEVGYGTTFTITIPYDLEDTL